MVSGERCLTMGKLYNCIIRMRAASSRFLLAAICISVCVEQAFAADGRKWLCVSEGASGFRWNGVSWEARSFRALEKYVLSWRTDDGEEGWKVNEMGSEFAWPCSLNDQTFNCTTFGEFFISLETLRYIKTYIVGYLEGVDSNENTPHIEIGTCSRL